MCNNAEKRSAFYRDEERHKEAELVAEKMRQMRERRAHEMTTIMLPNGAIVSSTSIERLKAYEEHCRRKTGYFAKP